MIDVREATTEDEIASARTLIHEFIGWLRQVYPEAKDALEEDFRAVEAELDTYKPPTGKLLVAYVDGHAAGIVALRDIGQRICEMKHTFVSAKFRGQGVGRALTITVIRDARALGYLDMRLGTGAKQVAAQGLYRSLGFREIPSYHEVSKRPQSALIFMERRL